MEWVKPAHLVLSPAHQMMLTIFVSFMVCFLPLMLVNVVDDAVTLPTLHVVASVLAWASAVINPFIYAFKNRQYQQAFKKVHFRINPLAPELGTFGSFEFFQ